MTMKPLTGDWRSWIKPIFSPVIVIIFSAGIYTFIVRDTALLAKNTVLKVEVNDITSRDRDEKLNVRATHNETRIVRLEECVIGIKGQLEDIKNQNIRILNKIDGIAR